MHKPELTIIIPCYNCEKTLREAVDSCFIQHLDSFEIVMVDDGSTDYTHQLMEKLRDEHPEHIRIFKNEINLGGGATRNRAVEESKSEIVFCLDSDDLLPEGSLLKMLKYIQEKQCDAVGIHKSIKFRGSDVTKIERIDVFSFAGEKITIESLLQKDRLLCPLYSTFMIKKSVHQAIGGYPTHHGFDTQGIAWRFLLNGYTAYTCPESSYLHRLYFNKSYYVREYESGKVNHNWTYIFDEFIYVFTKDVLEVISNFKVNGYENIFAAVTKIKNVFIENIPKNQESYLKILTGSEKQTRLSFWETYWLGVYNYLQHNYQDSFTYLVKTQSYATFKPLIASRVVRSAQKVGMVGTLPRKTIDMSDNFLRYTTYGSQSSLLKKVFRRIYKLFKKPE